MIKKTLKTIGMIITLILIVYSIHKGIFSVLDFKLKSLSFKYSLEKLYLWYGTFSVLLILILILVKQKNLNIVGNTFLLLTTVKLVITYVVARPILAITNKENNVEKWNFFILFILFLCIETIVTIRLLNQKD
jgi:hypothetical protein